MNLDCADTAVCDRPREVPGANIEIQIFSPKWAVPAL